MNFYVVFDISYGSKSDIRVDLLVSLALLINKSKLRDNSTLPKELPSQAWAIDTLTLVDSQPRGFSIKAEVTSSPVLQYF